MLEQTPVHENVSAADTLHEVEVAGLVEKTRQIPRHSPARAKDGPQDIVLEHVGATNQRKTAVKRALIPPAAAKLLHSIPSPRQRQRQGH